jgi:hypothetical protein
MNSLRNRSTPPLRPVIAEAASAVQGTSGGSSRQPDVRAAVDELLFIQGRLLCVVAQLNIALPPVVRPAPAQDQANAISCLQVVPDLRSPLALTLHEAAVGLRLLVNQLEGLLDSLER